MPDSTKLWTPPSAHRHQVSEEGHERLQAGHDARCVSCGVRFKVHGQIVITLPG